MSSLEGITRLTEFFSEILASQINSTGMIVSIRTLICTLLIVTFLLASGCTQGTMNRIATPTPSNPPPAPFVTAATKEDLVAFVRSAVAYAHANTKELSLIHISEPTRPY